MLKCILKSTLNHSFHIFKISRVLCKLIEELKKPIH